MAHRVGIIGGDGIGPEVTAEALKVVRAAGVTLDTVDYDLGGRRYLATGEVLPDAVLESITIAFLSMASSWRTRASLWPCSFLAAS